MPSVAPINLVDTAKYYKAAPHQDAALRWLQEQIPADKLDEFAKKWRIVSTPAATPVVAKEFIFDNSFASRIIRYLQLKKYKVFTGKRQFNIVYVEGCNGDGKPNSDRPNEWNDRRIVIEIVQGVPKIVGNWVGTSEPGDYYTYNPFYPSKGCARIQFGQYKAWKLGMHNGNHEALVQTGGSIIVCRDLDQNFSRVGDLQESGYYGVNQHWGYDMDRVGRASAGCLVGQSKQGHREFMSIVKSDIRFQADDEYIFWTAIIPGDDLAKKFPLV